MNKTDSLQSDEPQTKLTKPRSEAPSTSAAPKETKQLIAVAAMALGLAGWLVSSAQAFNLWPSEANFAAACERNQLKHAYSNYCVDDRRIVHRLAPDGTTSRPGFDWNVNNAAVVRAEAAVRYARRSQAVEH